MHADISLMLLKARPSKLIFAITSIKELYKIEQE